MQKRFNLFKVIKVWKMVNMSNLKLISYLFSFSCLKVKFLVCLLSAIVQSTRTFTNRKAYLNCFQTQTLNQEFEDTTFLSYTKYK